MGFVAVIPARFASTRLPGKPLADIGGVPMVGHVARRARESGADEVIVATDHDDIAAAVTRLGFTAELTRPDHPSGTDRIAEVAARRGWPGEQVVVNVQGDEPLIDPHLIRAVAQLLARDPQAAIATAAHPLHEAEPFIDPNVVKVVTDVHGHALYFSRAPIPWPRDARPQPGQPLAAGSPVLRHIGLYAYRASFLHDYGRLAPTALERCEALEQLRALWHGYRIAVLATDAAPHPGVDTEADLERVREHYSLLPRNNPHV